MRFQVSDGEKYQKIMQVEIPAEEMENQVKFACKRLANKVNIPGFRPGKAPRVILESQLGIEAILEEAADGVIGEAYAQGLRETGLEPVARPQIETVQLEKDKPFIFKAHITVKPEITLGQYKELKLTRRIVAVEEDEIDKEIEMQRQRMSKLIDAAEGEQAAAGDVVTIDFRGLKDGVAFDGGTGESYPLELGSHTFIPGFEEQLLGAKVGDEKNIEVTFPAEYHEPSLAGAPVVFETRVKEIKHKVLPELDDEFLQEASETAETLEQFRDEIRARFAERNLGQANDNALGEAVAKATENAEVDIPPVMIEQQLDDMIADMGERMKQQGLTLEQYLEYTGMTMEKLRENYQPQAAFMVKRNLMLDAIIKAEDIQVSDEEVAEQIKVMAVQYWQPEDKMREMLEKNNALDDIRYSLQMQKATNLLTDSAVITDETITIAELRAEQEKAQAEAKAKAAGQPDGEKEQE
ncbi:MAG: trigger factor [Bacillota bacterium]|nr:trigger factor [Bacillota bacterium]